MVRTLIRRGAVAGVTLLGIEAAYAVLRPSPVLESFDPSGEFGHVSLPTIKVAALGDSSITAPGVGSPDEIWVRILANRLAASRRVILKSYAIGGSMAHNVLADQVGPAVEFGPDLALVSVGANDVLKGVPTRVFRSNLDQVVTTLSGTGATVIQSGVGVMGTVPRLYPPLSTLMSRRSGRFDRIHREIAAKHGTHVIDQRSDDARLWNRDRSLWAEDYFHVSAAGHARWAETTWRTLEPLMNGSNESS
ncbi:MAG TPA: SGNH/GDSL hydrolase family protein [Acidimicrobiia bacterium]|nr:SGNH/GDSL hydrolase family protein [Acidimicrobiia bacterium]